jgi:hypothetical protein
VVRSIWSIQKVCNVNGTTEHSIQKVHKLLAEHGILTTSEVKKEIAIQIQTKSRVTEDIS